MKNCFLFVLALVVSTNLFSQKKVRWISTTESAPWQSHKDITTDRSSGPGDITVDPAQTYQTIEGFGACFNELGWTSLGLLSAHERDGILREMFAPGLGANFTICRMPVGANDFSRDWYSYNESDGDFEMKHFSIARDRETLIPFIRSAQKFRPDLKIWASPWSPPTWMKYNRHYAAKSILGNVTFRSEEFGMDLAGINNGLPAYREGKEGTDMFIQEDKYFRAYAKYFRRFVDAYKDENIRISMVMPQNEFNSAQVFPSCTWTPQGLRNFLVFLGPEMQAAGVDIFLGTVERADEKLVDSAMAHPLVRRYVRGAGFQWAGKGAIAAVHSKYPDLPLYQTEQECGNGLNDWKYAVYAWSLMKHYFSNGVNAYMYWNISLQEGGISTWGWRQNSLVSVNADRTFKYNHEFYLVKHLSHFVVPGARRAHTTGSFDNVLAFVNPDNSVIVAIYNDGPERRIRINIGDRSFSPRLQANSFHTFAMK